MAGAAAAMVGMSNEDRIKAMVPDTTAETAAKKRAAWEAQDLEAKRKDIRTRSDGILASNAADDATLNSLNQHYSQLGH